MWGPGTELCGRYRLITRIGIGAMGDIWRAEDQVLGRFVAVKILLPALLEDSAFTERFRREARLLAALSHPGIVPVFDYGEVTDPRAAFLVMELIDGPSLNTVLTGATALGPARTLRIIAQTLDALHAAHDRGVVHRDIKPANLLLRGDRVVVTDFGVASLTGAQRLTVADTLLGSAVYGAPEQARQTVITAAADIYSVGVVGYECLVGTPPFDGENALAVMIRHVQEPVPPLSEQVPVAVRHIIYRALAKDPADRYPTAQAMAAAARAALAELPTGSEPESGSSVPSGASAALDRASVDVGVPFSRRPEPAPIHSGNGNPGSDADLVADPTTAAGNISGVEQASSGIGDTNPTTEPDGADLDPVDPWPDYLDSADHSRSLSLDINATVDGGPGTNGPTDEGNVAQPPMRQATPGSEAPTVDGRTARGFASGKRILIMTAVLAVLTVSAGVLIQHKGSTADASGGTARNADPAASDGRTATAGRIPAPSPTPTSVPASPAKTPAGSKSPSRVAGRTTSPTNTTPPPTGVATGVSRIIGWQNLCVDVPNYNGVSGQYLQVSACNGMSAQNWTFEADKTIRIYGLCMDVKEGSLADGAWIELFYCNGTAAQRFVLNNAGDLVNLQSKRCVDVTDSGGSGTHLQQWMCNGGGNQKWRRA
jgi:serine/threonine protein kinase